MRLAFCLLALVAGCSCASSPPTRPDGGVVNARSGNGRVLCSSFDQIADATKAADAIDRYFDLAAKRLGHTNPRPVEIWLDPTWAGQAITLEHRIVFNPSNGAINGADLILAHEFVHWHFQASTHAGRLPHPIVEGICDCIAVELVDRFKDVRRAQIVDHLDAVHERGDLPRLISQLGVGIRQFEALTDDDQVSLAAIGFTLVERIGVEALRDAAERGPVTPEAILEMAGVGADGTGL